MQVSNVRLELHLITYRTRNKTMNAEVDPETLTPVRHLMLWKLLRCHRSINYCTPNLHLVHVKQFYIYTGFSEVYVKITKISSWIRPSKIIS